jgi:hypothetical protein
VDALVGTVQAGVCDAKTGFGRNAETGEVIANVRRSAILASTSTLSSILLAGVSLDYPSWSVVPDT